MAPRRDMDELQEQIQELFNDLWQVPRFSGLRHGFRPEADCYRLDDPPELHVLVELPGVDADSIKFKLISPLRPAVLEGDTPDYVYLIMPIRLAG